MSFKFFKHMQSRTHSISFEETPSAFFLSLSSMRVDSVWRVPDGESHNRSVIVRTTRRWLQFLKKFIGTGVSSEGSNFGEQPERLQAGS